MKINPALDIDNDIENLASGSICHASNVLVNATNDAILTENSITEMFHLEDREEIVGQISASDEFIVFTSANRILRVKEDGETIINIQTNWSWQGGEVIGCYTYNVKDQMIIAISERRPFDEEQIPIKVINLDDPDYVPGASDNQYVIAPNLPFFNMTSYHFNGGTSIDKGMYTFFIRFKKDEDYTGWFPIGVPVQCSNQDYAFNSWVGYWGCSIRCKKVFGQDTHSEARDACMRFSYSMSDYVDDKATKVPYNIILTITVTNQKIQFEKYQIGYIVTTTENETKTYTTQDYNITTNNVIIDNSLHDETSVDELTANTINIYNAHTICAYGNRVYAGHYWEENPNINVPNINVSGIKVKAVKYDIFQDEEINTESINALAAKTNALSNTALELSTLSETPTTRVGDSTEQSTNDFDQFETGWNYLVNMYVNYKVDETTSVGCNIRLHCNRINNDNGLIIDIDDILHACCMATGAKISNTHAGYLTINGLQSTIGGFIIYCDGAGSYLVRPFLSTDYDYVYPTSNSTLGTFVSIGPDTETSGLFTWNDIVIGKSNPVVLNDGDNSCDIHYTIPEEDYTGDIYVTGVTRFKSQNALKAIEPCWFYDSVITTSDGTEYEAKGIFDGNSSLQPYNNNILRTDGQRYYVGAHGWNIIDNHNAFMNVLKATYPESTYDYYCYEYVVDENNESVGTNDSYKFQIIDGNVVIGYDRLTLSTCPFYIKIDNNITKLNDNIQIVERAVPSNVINTTVSNIMSSSTTQRTGLTLNDLIEYYDSGQQTYNWTNDRTPTANDFDPDIAYNGQFTAVWKNPTSGSDGFPYTFKLYNRSPIAVGFKNLTDNGDGTYNVDKDFAILISLQELVEKDNTPRAMWKGLAPSNNSQITLYTGADNTFTGYYNRFYFVFTKSDTTTYDGENVYNGYLCYLREDCELSDSVPVFDVKYSFADASGGGSYVPTAYPYFVVNGTTTSFYGGATLYSNLITDESIDTFTGLIFGSEYIKCAINYAVYNFYIHFVLPDGNVTDGIKINNTATYNFNLPIAAGHTYACDETTTIGVIKAYCDENSITTGWDKTYRINSYFNIGDDVRICNIFPQFNSNGIALYINNNGDKFFRGTYDYEICEEIKAIKFEFDNIPEPDGYVGYFISYEKPEPILLGRGPIVGETAIEPYVPIYDEDQSDHDTYATLPLDLQSANYNNKFITARFYYPEFSIINSALGATQFITEKYILSGNVERGQHLKKGWSVIANEQNNFNNYTITGITNSKILIPNDANENGGREGCLRISFGETEDDAITIEQICEINEKSVYTIPDALVEIYKNMGSLGDRLLAKCTKTEGTQTNGYTIGIALKIRSNIYNARNKELIPLGYTKYYDGTGTYGYEDFRYNYDYFYNNYVPIYSFNRYGAMFNEVDIIPKYFNQSERIHRDSPYRVCQCQENYIRRFTDAGTRQNTNFDVQYDEKDKNGKAPIFRFVFSTFNTFDIKSVQVDQEPIENYYTVDDPVTGETYSLGGQEIASVYTKYIYPAYVNDLYTLPSCYNTYAGKLFTNYDSTNYANFLQFYGQTVRRSDVMADESTRNAWRFWRIDNYKMISENKGLIYNVVGVGAYLIVHTEHSLFVFDRTNQLDAENKTVQTLMPDAFDIDYTEVFTVDKGYAGLQEFHHWTVCDAGYVFLDKDARKVYQWDDGNLNDITQGMQNIFKFIDDIRIASEELNNRFIVMCKLTLPEPNILTISYSLPYKEWVSTHSYHFDSMFNTKSNIYFIDKTGQNSICKFDESTYNNYVNVIDDNTNFFKTEMLNDKPASYIDVITNNEGIDKVLDYITYRINKATDDRYSGDKILIYTNCCYSNYKDVSTPRRGVTDWKNPVYRYGIWVVNWFRNWIKPISTVHPIIRGSGKFDNNAGELGKQINNNALIVGKYFVVRLIFRDDTRRISIDDVQTY